MVPEENFCLVLDMSSTFPSRNKKTKEDVGMRFFSFNLFFFFHYMKRLIFFFFNLR